LRQLSIRPSNSTAWLSPKYTGKPERSERSLGRGGGWEWSDICWFWGRFWRGGGWGWCVIIIGGMRDVGIRNSSKNKRLAMGVGAVVVGVVSYGFGGVMWWSYFGYLCLLIINPLIHTNYNDEQTAEVNAVDQRRIASASESPRGQHP
jgi:hypothetical protein